MTIVKWDKVGFAAVAAATLGIFAVRHAKRSRFHALVQYMKSLVDDGHIPFITFKLQRLTKTVFEYSYGSFTTPATQLTKFNNNTIIRIYSMTKIITSVAVLILLEQVDHFDLDSPISNYIPEWNDDDIRVLVQGEDSSKGLAEVKTEPAKRPITARQLLSHTAGLDYGFWSDELGPVSRFMCQDGLELPVPITCDSRRENKTGNNYPTSLKDFCIRLQKIPLMAHPGEVFHYSCATDVLGRIIECLDPKKRSFDTFLEEVLFQPLGMRDTSFTIANDKLSRFAPCFTTDERLDVDSQKNCAFTKTGKTCRFKLFSSYSSGEVCEASPWHEHTTGNFKVRQCPSGGGGLLSTINDYMKFLNFLHSGRAGQRQLLSLRTLHLMREDTLAPRGILRAGLSLSFDGFGLGVSCVTRRNALTGEPVKESLENPGGRHASHGTGGWSEYTCILDTAGAALTNCWIDPEKHVSCALGTQLLYIGCSNDHPGLFLRQHIAKLAMEALFGNLGSSDSQIASISTLI